MSCEKELMTYLAFLRQNFLHNIGSLIQMKPEKKLLLNVWNVKVRNCEWIQDRDSEIWGQFLQRFTSSFYKLKKDCQVISVFLRFWDPSV